MKKIKLLLLIIGISAISISRAHAQGDIDLKVEFLPAGQSNKLTWTAVELSTDNTKEYHVQYHIWRRYGMLSPTADLTATASGSDPTIGATTAPEYYVGYVEDGTEFTDGSGPGTWSYVVRAYDTYGDGTNGEVTGVGSGRSDFLYGSVKRGDANGSQEGHGQQWFVEYQLQDDAYMNIRIYEPGTQFAADGNFGFAMSTDDVTNVYGEPVEPVKTILGVPYGAPSSTSATRSFMMAEGDYWNKDIWDCRDSNGHLVENGKYVWLFECFQYYEGCNGASGDNLFPGDGPADYYKTYAGWIEIPVDILRILDVTATGITDDNPIGSVSYSITGDAEVKFLVCKSSTEFRVATSAGQMNYLSNSATYYYQPGDLLPKDPGGGVNGERILVAKTVFRQSGQRSEAWNGKDDGGSPVDNGVYVYGISAHDGFGNSAVSDTGNDSPVQGTIVVNRSSTEEKRYNLTVTWSPGDKSNALSWDAIDPSASDASVVYHVFRDTGYVSVSTTPIAIAETSSYVDVLDSPYVTYAYRVRAYDSSMGFWNYSDTETSSFIHEFREDAEGIGSGEFFSYRIHTDALIDIKIYPPETTFVKDGQGFLTSPSQPEVKALSSGDVRLSELHDYETTSTYYENEEQWDLKDSSGTLVTSGIYRILIEAYNPLDSTEKIDSRVFEYPVFDMIVANVTAAGIDASRPHAYLSYFLTNNGEIKIIICEPGTKFNRTWSAGTLTYGGGFEYDYEPGDWIPYDVSGSTDASLIVKYFKFFRTMGSHTEFWDGRYEGGDIVLKGNYIFAMSGRDGEGNLAKGTENFYNLPVDPDYVSPDIDYDLKVNWSAADNGYNLTWKSVTVSTATASVSYIIYRSTGYQVSVSSIAIVETNSYLDKSGFGPYSYRVKARDSYLGLRNYSRVARASFIEKISKVDGFGFQQGWGQKWELSYDLLTDAYVNISVYEPGVEVSTMAYSGFVDTTTLPAPVKTLVSFQDKNSASRPSGTNRETWDCRDSSGNVVGSGMYRVVFEAFSPYEPNPKIDDEVVLVPVDILRLMEISATEVTDINLTGSIDYQVTGDAEVKVLLCTPGTELTIALSSDTLNYVIDGSTYVYSYEAGENVPVDTYVVGSSTYTDRIVKLYTDYRKAGTYSQSWTGLDENGKLVANGIYVVGISATDSYGNRAYNLSGDESPVYVTIPVNRQVPYTEIDYNLSASWSEADNGYKLSWDVVEPSISGAKVVYYVYRSSDLYSMPVSSVAVVEAGSYTDSSGFGPYLYRVRAYDTAVGWRNFSDGSTAVFINNISKVDGFGFQQGWGQKWELSYDLLTDAYVNIEVYQPGTSFSTDTVSGLVVNKPTGNIVKRIVNVQNDYSASRPSGSNTETWDCRDSSGSVVSSGMYQILLEVYSPYDATKKIDDEVVLVPVDNLRILNFTATGVSPTDPFYTIDYQVTGDAEVKILICAPGTEFRLAIAPANYDYVIDGTTYTYDAEIGDNLPLDPSTKAVDQNRIVRYIKVWVNAGSSRWTWDATDENGTQVSNGIYTVGISARDTYGNPALGETGNDSPISVSYTHLTLPTN